MRLGCLARRRGRQGQPGNVDRRDPCVFSLYVLLEDVLQILLCRTLGQVLQEQDLVGGKVLVGHLDRSSRYVGRSRLTRAGVG